MVLFQTALINVDNQNIIDAFGGNKKNFLASILLQHSSQLTAFRSWGGIWEGWFNGDSAVAVTHETQRAGRCSSIRVLSLVRVKVKQWLKHNARRTTWLKTMKNYIMLFILIVSITFNGKKN